MRDDHDDAINWVRLWKGDNDTLVRNPLKVLTNSLYLGDQDSIQESLSVGEYKTLSIAL